MTSNTDGNFMRALLYCMCATVLVAGCGPRTATVSGSVTIDGTPLDGGTIAFAAAEGNAPPVSTNVTAGRYSVTMVAGKKKVQISAPGPKKQVPVYQGSTQMMDVGGPERLPAKYNSATTLTFDAKGGSETKDWETSTK